MLETLVATKGIAAMEAQDVQALSRLKGEPEWMTQRRLAAWRVFQDTPRPTTRDEPWRRTDIRRLKLDPVVPASGDARLSDLPARWQAMVGTEDQAGLALHADGGNAYVSLEGGLARQGVIFTDMATALREHGDWVAPFFMHQAVRPTDGYFAALNGAVWSGGTFLYVPQNVQVELPLQTVTWAGPGAHSFTHTLVVVEAGARATLVEEFASQEDKGGAPAVHNGVVELIVNDGAQLDYVNVQDWARDAFNFSTERAVLARDATLHWVVGGIGSRLTKRFIDASLLGAGATALMSGLFFGDGRQHLDYDTQQNHVAPHTSSDLLYKGALKDEARSVWQGMIKVLPGAQKTDGYQANRNLLLNRSARADSIPGLEIEADDVRCTHGATVSQLDPEELFYVRSRGLPFEDAQRLIVQGFFAPVIARVPMARVRQRLTDAILKKIG